MRVAVHRLRRRYRDLLREEVAQTLSNPTQADEEMQALFSALAEGGAANFRINTPIQRPRDGFVAGGAVACW